MHAFAMNGIDTANKHVSSSAVRGMLITLTFVKLKSLLLGGKGLTLESKLAP